MIDWKIILAIFVALILLTGGIVKDLGKSVEEGDVKKLLGEIKEKISNVINLSDFSLPVERDLNVTGYVGNENKFEFKLNNIDMAMKFNPNIVNLSADKKDVDIDKENSQLVLRNFNGDADITSNEVNLEGNAKSLAFEEFKIEGEETTISIKGKYNKIDLQNIEIPSLQFKKGGGKLDIGPSVTISVKDKPLELHGFLGNLTFSKEKLMVEGKVSKARSGKQKIAVSGISI